MTDRPYQDAPGAAIQRPQKRAKRSPVRFRANTPASQSKCGRLQPDGRACPNQASTHHHWVPARWIRGFARSLGWADQHLAGVLADDRNLTPMCFDCHQEGEGRAGRRRFRWDEIPVSAITFAIELHMQHAIIRLYPPGIG